MVQPDDIETYIRQGLDCTHLRVDGDGHHFEAVIVSPAFEGLRLVARHQKGLRGARRPHAPGNSRPVNEDAYAAGVVRAVLTSFKLGRRLYGSFSY
jgi:hypothetical protein